MSSSFSNLRVTTGTQSLLGSNRRSYGNSVKAMAAGEGRDNLNTLQRASKHQSSTQHQQPKRRVAPVAPIGLCNGFSSASTVQQMMEEEEWSAKRSGSFNCRIALPDNIKIEKIKAEMKDGTVYTTIPTVPK